jgi:hypothetical protein
MSIAKEKVGFPQLGTVPEERGCIEHRFGMQSIFKFF